MRSLFSEDYQVLNQDLHPQWLVLTLHPRFLHPRIHLILILFYALYIKNRCSVTFNIKLSHSKEYSCCKLSDNKAFSYPCILPIKFHEAFQGRTLVVKRHASRLGTLEGADKRNLRIFRKWCAEHRLGWLLFEPFISLSKYERLIHIIYSFNSINIYS